MEYYYNRHKEKKTGVVHRDTFIETLDATYQAQVDATDDDIEKSALYAGWASQLYDSYFNEKVTETVDLNLVEDKARKSLKYNPGNFEALKLLTFSLELLVSDDTKDKKIIFVELNELYPQIIE